MSRRGAGADGDGLKFGSDILLPAAGVANGRRGREPDWRRTR